MTSRLDPDSYHYVIDNCPTCDGRGWTPTPVWTPTHADHNRETCPDCNDGRIIKEN